MSNDSNGGLSPAELERSSRLLAKIHTLIDKNGGRISFARYMESALYDEELGYYCAPRSRLPMGRDGDFATAPEISTLFAQTLSRGLSSVCKLGFTRLLEVGAGSGVLAEGLIKGLEQEGVSLDRYEIYEVSPALRKRQQERLFSRIPQYFSRLHWHDSLPSSFEGIVLANEVLDALPIHLVSWGEQGIQERSVANKNGKLFIEEHALSNTPESIELGAAAKKLPPQQNRAHDYQSEVSLAIPHWIRDWGSRLTQGMMFLFDYGYPQEAYYHPERTRGTLMCYQGHRGYENPLEHPGLRDITTHVDFTLVAEAAKKTGLHVAGYASQANFLVNCGLLNILAQTNQNEDAFSRAQRNCEAQRLISPNAMGEAFKVMALSKTQDLHVPGFQERNRRMSLI